jgi:hypothetical protein
MGEQGVDQNLALSEHLLEANPGERHPPYILEHNRDPEPFVWTKTADVLLAKISRLPVPSVESED